MMWQPAFPKWQAYGQADSASQQGMNGLFSSVFEVVMYA